MGVPPQVVREWARQTRCTPDATRPVFGAMHAGHLPWRTERVVDFVASPSLGSIISGVMSNRGKGSGRLRLATEGAAETVFVIARRTDAVPLLHVEALITGATAGLREHRVKVRVIVHGSSCL